MNRKIHSALISVYYKDSLEPLVQRLHALGVKIFSTGGTQHFIEQLGIPCIAVETLTGYPSILGGRVKTLHPKVFGGILARRGHSEDLLQLTAHDIPTIDLVIVDLYPFEETVASTDEEKNIIEKIDIGGVSLIRAAAKNYADVCVVAAKKQYAGLLEMLEQAQGMTTLDERRKLAAQAFAICADYDTAIAQYFNQDGAGDYFQFSVEGKYPLRYGENPHQKAAFYGNLHERFMQMNGKELSFNNIVDADAACKIAGEFSSPVFAVIKHTNVCGIALRDTVADAWQAALACDPESAFGGVLITNTTIDFATALKISEIFFEIIIAPAYAEEALDLLTRKKNRIVLVQKSAKQPDKEFKQVLNGVLVQDEDTKNAAVWNEVGARASSETEHGDLEFANIVCKHLKSNAIAIINNKQLIGKGCGQTSRIDALRQALDKAKQFGFDTKGAVLASDAFFPFNDCVRMAHEAGITAVIQPGGSMRDNDSIQYCKDNGMAMVITNTRHFKH